jgi:phage terminase large subunit-like protein
LAKTGGIGLSVTNAFREGEESVAEQDHDSAMKGAAGLLYVAPRAPYVADLADRELVSRSLRAVYDPGASWVDYERLADECQDEGIPPGERRRYYFNLPDKFTDESWLPEGRWESCRRRGRAVNLDSPFVVAVDMALRHDTCAIRWGQFQHDGKIMVEAKEFVPHGDMLDIDAIEAFILRLQASGNLSECAYDPAYFERSAQALSERGVNMVEFPQSNQYMVQACATAYEYIMAGTVVHDDEAMSLQQVVNGVSFPAGEGWRLKKSKVRHGKIDSAIALVILLARLVSLDQLADEAPDPFAFAL